MTPDLDKVDWGEEGVFFCKLGTQYLPLGTFLELRSVRGSAISYPRVLVCCQHEQESELPIPRERSRRAPPERICESQLHHHCRGSPFHTRGVRGHLLCPGFSLGIFWGDSQFTGASIPVFFYGWIEYHYLSFVCQWPFGF